MAGREDLKFLVILGSIRDTTPPRPARLGKRVALASLERLRAAKATANLIDVLEVSLSDPFKPHFAYAAGKAPAALDCLATEIEAADGYVMVSPEYNHSMSPALAHLLNHFGSSLFSYKPSAIVTYSAGQWGGARAAVAMRAFLSELGCLPVSAMIHLPKAPEVLDDDGGYLDGSAAPSWNSYFDRTFDQLRWWAAAAKSGRQTLPDRPDAFTRAPSQRNAPS